MQYYDAKVDDARHTMELARTAATYGAHVASRVAAIGFLRQGERVTGIRALDKMTGREFDVHARQVVNATGVWTDDTQAMVGERGQFHVRASKGIHLVVPRDRIHSTSGIILRTEKSVLFVIPWGRHWIIGTTDTQWDLDKAHPAATSADIEYLLEHVNKFLTTRLTQADVEGVYAGLRPLLAGESEQTSKLSREHVVAHPTPGLIVVAGGKYTTYRIMARDAIDEAARTLGGSVPESTTQEIPLVGAVGYHAMWNRRAALAEESGLHVERIEKMLMRHGILTTEILDLIEADRSLGDPLPGGEDYLRAEIAYAASHEGALHLDDVLARRTRLSIETWDRAVGASRPAAEIVAPILGWDADTVDKRGRALPPARRGGAHVADDARRRGSGCGPADRPGHQRLSWSGRPCGVAGPTAARFRGPAQHRRGQVDWHESAVTLVQGLFRRSCQSTCPHRPIRRSTLTPGCAGRSRSADCGRSRRPSGRRSPGGTPQSWG